MLIVDNAYFAESATPAPAVTLRLDGHQTSVVDSFNPHRKIQATALWNGQQLRSQTTDKYTTTQVVSVEASQLVVVTSSNSDPEQRVILGSENSDTSCQSRRCSPAADRSPGTDRAPTASYSTAELPVLATSLALTPRRPHCLLGRCWPADAARTEPRDTPIQRLLFGP